MQVATLPRRRLVSVLATAVGLVFLASLIAPFFRFVLAYERPPALVRLGDSLFALNREANISTWLAATLLLLCAITLAVMGRVERARASPLHRHWSALAVLFVYLSVDEASGLHERWNVAVPWVIDLPVKYGWVAVGALGILVLGFIFLPFIRALPSDTRRLAVIAGAVFVVGALGLETVAGYLHAGSSDVNFRESGINVLLTHAEELMELSGVLLFLHALLRHLDVHVGTVGLSFDEASSRYPE